jgi:ribosomal protein S18 acetylase RimI-like enzyme
MTYTIREFTAADERSWLRCRVLSFLSTPYFDDVLPAKPVAAAPRPGLDLVAVSPDGTVVGIMDTTIEGDLATIDTVAVHPDHQRHGLGSRLLNHTRARVRALGLSTLDAWTRDDPDTLAWYRAVGFTESDHYLHVYADYRDDRDEPDRAIGSRRPGMRPMSSFSHATLDQQDVLQAEFTRVHVCRRFSMTP